MANDDNLEGVTASLLQKYHDAKVSVEAHVLARGGHGFNMGDRSKLASVKGWPQRLADWMGDSGFGSSAVWNRNVGGVRALTRLSVESSRTSLGSGLSPSREASEPLWVKGDPREITGYAITSSANSRWRSAAATRPCPPACR